MTISFHFIVLAAFLAAAVFLYWRRFRGELPILFLLCLGLSIFTIRLAQTDIRQYAYDLYAHIETLQFYAGNLSIPNLHEGGGETHQPPLYYALSELLYRIAVSVGEDYLLEPVRYFSLFIFAMFLLYGAEAICLMVKPKELRFLGVLALVLWPANLLHCCRITNDQLLYLSFLACCYHLARYRHCGGALRQLTYALLWMGICLLTKATGFVLCLPVAYAIIARCRRDAAWPLSHEKFGRERQFFLLGTGFVILSVIGGYARHIANFFTHHAVSIIQSAGEPALREGFVASEYLQFDYSCYIRTPYFQWGKCVGDASYFWNFLLKSMLYGEHGWNGITQAVLMNALLLAMWLFLAALLFHRYLLLQRKPGGEAPWVVYMAVTLLALALVKASYHNHPWADVRHVYFLIPFFLVVYLRHVDIYRRTGARRVARLGVIMLSGLTGLAAIHIFLQLT